MADLPPPTAAAVAAATSETEEEDTPDVPVDNSMPTDRRLPRYLSNQPALSYQEMLEDELADILQEEEYTGDSDDEEVVESHTYAVLNSARDRALAFAGGWDDVSCVEDDDLSPPPPPPPAAAPAPTLPIYKPPDDWTPPACKEDKREIPFSSVDNPGEWDQYTFRPKFDRQTKLYTHHELTGGAQVVPEVDGKRKVGDWEFFYKGWTHDGDSFRPGATPENLFPSDRKGSLDGEMLKKLGLTRKRMEEVDALFFHQLLLPICTPQKSGVEGDPRRGYYEEVTKLTSLYALLNELGTGPMDTM